MAYSNPKHPKPDSVSDNENFDDEVFDDEIFDESVLGFLSLLDRDIEQGKNLCELPEYLVQAMQQAAQSVLPKT